MTENELKQRLDIIRVEILKQKPPFTIGEASDFMKCITDVSTPPRTYIFDTVEDEVGFLLKEAEKIFVRKVNH
jgi:hypothetical protein